MTGYDILYGYDTVFGVTPETNQKSTLHNDGVLLSKHVYQFLYFHLVHIQLPSTFHCRKMEPLPPPFIPFVFLGIILHECWFCITLGARKYINQIARRSRYHTLFSPWYVCLGRRDRRLGRKRQVELEQISLESSERIWRHGILAHYSITWWQSARLKVQDDGRVERNR